MRSGVRRRSSAGLAPTRGRSTDRQRSHLHRHSYRTRRRVVMPMFVQT